MKPFIIIFTLFVSLFCQAQNNNQLPKNYQEAIYKGKFELNKQNYNKAIDLFLAAQAFDPTKRDSVRYYLNDAFSRINKLKNQAEVSKRKALLNLIIADSLLKISNKLRKQSEKERKKSDSLFIVTDKKKSEIKILLSKRDSIINIQNNLLNSIYFHNNNIALTAKYIENYDKVSGNSLPNKYGYRTIKYGYINKKGNKIIDYIYDKASFFENNIYYDNYSLVTRGNSNFLIDTSGYEYLLATSLSELNKKHKALMLTSKGLKKFPKKILNFSQLEILILYNNRITNIPNDIDKLKNLKVLNLGANMIEFLPKNLFKLKKLQQLNLQINKISSIPDDIEYLNNLKILNIGRNPLKNISNKLYTLYKLVTLDISFNNPLMYEQNPPNALNVENIGNLNKLETLYLVNTGLKKFPPSIFSLKNIKLLNLSDNFIDSIPNEISKFNNLQFLSIDYNNIKDIPTNLYSLKKIKRLSISNNKLSSFKENIWLMPKLKFLDLSSNRIKNIPSINDINNSLQILELSFNEIESIPNSINNLLSLYRLSLNSTYSIVLPKEICQLKKLSELDLGLGLKPRNYPTIPNCIINSSKLNYNYPKFWLSIAKKYFYNQEFGLSIKALHKINNNTGLFYKLNSDDLENVQYMLGYSYFKLNQKDKAIIHFNNIDKNKDLLSNYFTSLLLLREIFIEKNEVSNIIYYTKKIIDIEPKLYTNYYILSKYYLLDGNLTKSKENILKSIKLRNKYGEYWDFPLEPYTLSPSSLNISCSSYVTNEDHYELYYYIYLAISKFNKANQILNYMLKNNYISKYEAYKKKYSIDYWKSKNTNERIIEIKKLCSVL